MIHNPLKVCTGRVAYPANELPPRKDAYTPLAKQSETVDLMSKDRNSREDQSLGDKMKAGEPMMERAVRALRRYHETQETQPAEKVEKV